MEAGSGAAMMRLRMIAAARQHDVCLMVAENVRFHATYRRVAELLQAGALGDVVIWQVDDYRYLGYRFGANMVDTVIKRGQVVYQQEMLA